MQTQNQASSSARWYYTANGLIMVMALSNLHTLTSSDFSLTPTSAKIERFSGREESSLTQDNTDRFSMLQRREVPIIQIDNPLDSSATLLIEADVADTATVQRLEAEARQFIDNYDGEFVDIALSSDDDWMR